MDERIEAIERDIASLRARNLRVDADKAWETSGFRVGAIAIMTYAVATLFMWSIGIARPWLNALIPVIGFALSTLSLPPIKRWWTARR